VKAMVGLGQGAAASVQAQIMSLGTNLLIIIPGATTGSGVRTGLGVVSTLTVDDAHEIERRVSNITRVSFASRVVLQATHENKNWSTVVLDASNAGIARNCWGARSCQRSTPCVLKKIVSR